MPLYSQLLQFILTGLTVGSIYGLVALGFNIIYNSTGIINLAQGEFVMLGGMSAVWLVESLHVPVFLAFPISVLMVTLVGIAMEFLAIRPVKKADVLSMIICTVGASVFFKGLVMFVWGKQMHALPHFSKDNPIFIAGASILPQTLWVWGITALIVLGLWLFFERTLLGKAMRACSYNRDAASLVGISATRMVMLSFALSAAVGAAAGVSITPITLMSYDRGTMLGLKGFAAGILGGLGNPFGGVVAGLMIGVLEGLAAGSRLSHYKDAVALVVLLAMLFIKPSGLFVGAEAGRLKKH